MDEPIRLSELIHIRVSPKMKKLILNVAQRKGLRPLDVIRMMLADGLSKQPDNQIIEHGEDDGQNS